MGLFAMEPILQGEAILHIDGTLVSTGGLSDEFLAAGHWQGVAPGWCLIRETEPSDFSLVNHSKRPNARVDLCGMNLVVVEDILPGIEILLDYDLEPMDARCRSLLGHLKPAH